MGVVGWCVLTSVNVQFYTKYVACQCELVPCA